MATLNLGRIKPIFQGAYNNSTAYVVDDIVTFGDETFICIQASTGNATSNASYWTKLAAKGTDGTDVGTTLTTQGDILYRDGSGLQRLAKGTANQTLQMNGAANAPNWVTASSGGLLQVKFHQAGTTQYSTTSGSFTDVGADYDITITPTASNSRIMLFTQTATQMSSQGRGYYTISKSGEWVKSNTDFMDLLNMFGDGLEIPLENYLLGNLDSGKPFFAGSVSRGNVYLMGGDMGVEGKLISVNENFITIYDGMCSTSFG